MIQNNEIINNNALYTTVDIRSFLKSEENTEINSIKEEENILVL